MRTDRYLMRHKAREIVEAAAALFQESGAKSCVIALKKDYTAAIAALQEAIREQSAPITLHLLDSFYPAGDEQILVCEVTGRVVPPAGIPLDVGCVVSNVATIHAVFHAKAGRPFIYKYVTVTGEVNKPAILKVPVGTAVAECLTLAGGTRCADFIVVNGGPMMGAVLSQEEALVFVVTKTTSGLIVLPKDSFLARHHEISLEHMLNRAKSVCIQCQYCTDFCPRHLLGHPLLPHKIMRRLALNADLDAMLADADIRNAALCCECGICERYACPMGLQPCRVNHLIKDALHKAGIRYSKSTDICEAHPIRESRKAPEQKGCLPDRGIALL